MCRSVISWWFFSHFVLFLPEANVAHAPLYLLSLGKNPLVPSVIFVCNLPCCLLLDRGVHTCHHTTPISGWISVAQENTFNPCFEGLLVKLICGKIIDYTASVSADSSDRLSVSRPLNTQSPSWPFPPCSLCSCAGKTMGKRHKVTDISYRKSGSVCALQHYKIYALLFTPSSYSGTPEGELLIVSCLNPSLCS